MLSRYFHCRRRSDARHDRRSRRNRSSISRRPSCPERRSPRRTPTPTTARSAMTDERGHFLIPALPPGPIRVRAELPGFSPRTLEDVVLTLGSLARSAVVAERRGRAGGRARRGRRAGDRPAADRRLERHLAGADRASADQRAQLHRVLAACAGRRHRSDAAAGRVGHIGPVVRRPARAIEQHHGRRARQQRFDASAACARRSARKPCASSRCSPIRIRAEFGKASGGVVNIVTKSGTNKHSRQSVLLPARRRAELEGPLRAVQPGRAGRSIATRPRTRRSSSAPRSAGRSSAIARSTSCRSSGSTSPPHNFVTIDDTNNVDVSRARIVRHARRDPAAGRLRGRDRPRARTTSGRISFSASSIIS